MQCVSQLHRRQGVAPTGGGGVSYVDSLQGCGGGEGEQKELKTIPGAWSLWAGCGWPAACGSVAAGLWHSLPSCRLQAWGCHGVARLQRAGVRLPSTSSFSEAPATGVMSLIRQSW